MLPGGGVFRDLARMNRGGPAARPKPFPPPPPDDRPPASRRDRPPSRPLCRAARARRRGGRGAAPRGVRPDVARCPHRRPARGRGPRAGAAARGRRRLPGRGVDALRPGRLRPAVSAAAGGARADRLAAPRAPGRARPSAIGRGGLGADGSHAAATAQRWQEEANPQLLLDEGRPSIPSARRRSSSAASPWSTSNAAARRSPPSSAASPSIPTATRLTTTSPAASPRSAMPRPPPATVPATRRRSRPLGNA